MELDETNAAAFRAAAFLFEGDETEALALLMQCEVAFAAAHDWTSDTGYNGHSPDTYTLHGPRKVVEAFQAKIDTSKQIEAAFDAAHGFCVVTARYKPMKVARQTWHETLAAELPAAGAIEATFVAETAES